MNLPEIVAQVLFYSFAAMAAIQLAYYLIFFFRLPASKIKSDAGAGKSIPVSVIICARNEREYLENNLESVLKQDHPDYQVVVVNDGSTDGTKAFLKKMDALHERLKVVTLDIDDRYHRGKKFALTMGIKAAKHPYLLMTDADCRPVSDQWISCMASGFKEEGREIVLGASFFPAAPSLLNLIIRTETFYTAMQYFNYALAGIPYMGVGRNLGYTRELFFRYKGFASHQHLLSGDDDLFVNETANRANVAIRYEKEAQTQSVPKKNFRQWHRQKLRHFSSSGRYRTKHKALLFFYSFTLFWFYILMTLVLMVNYLPFLVLGIFGLRLVVQGISFFGNMKKLGQLSLLWFLPLLDILLILVQLFVGLRGSARKPKKWN